MRIGIDIDGVITDIERFMLDYGAKYFVEINLPLNISLGEYDDTKFYNCSEEQAIKFWNEYLVYYATEYEPRDFAQEVMKKLKEDGNEIYIITARDDYGLPQEFVGKMKEMVEKWLEENDIRYDKIIYTEGSKLPYCVGNYIDVMVEDSPENIKDISTKIPTICFNCFYNKDVKGENITRAYSWYDVYEIIKNM